MPWPKPRRTGFSPTPVYVRFVVGKVALRQVFFLLALRFPPVSIMPPVLRTHPIIQQRRYKITIEFDQLFIDTKSTYDLQVGIPDGD